ncbi:hypothetical protein Vadar_003782 [Vaccinium darrowii]|uniref:Uncharacterized protein n=1 Tax=Vaccinium darrowii TaxID=229202 RepID=A0ACB7ZH88_9ERIC|nr:hypothetical protein Vadar_003782 [Vaccinium darrowii]
MQNSIDELKKNQALNTATTEGPQTTPIVSPSLCVALLLNRVTTNPDTDCKLLHWTGTEEVVVEGRWSSSDPNERFHHISLGPNATRVWVDIAKNGAAFLWRPTSDMQTVEEAVGTTVAWHADKVLMDSTPRLLVHLPVDALRSCNDPFNCLSIQEDEFLFLLSSRLALTRENDFGSTNGVSNFLDKCYTSTSPRKAPDLGLCGRKKVRNKLSLKSFLNLSDYLQRLGRQLDH